MNGPWYVVLSVVAACLLSAVGTGLVRRYAMHGGILDVPNLRSSHQVPMPRGGGVAIVLVVLAAIATEILLGLLVPRVGLALLAGGGIVALVGWVDDRRALGALPRFIVQLMAAAIVVWAVGGLPSLTLGAFAGTSLRLWLGVLGYPIGILVILWMTNLFNFMDGIDGIAAGEAASVAVAGGGFLLAAGEQGLALVVFCVAAAALGFLYWNWPPARIFMGDVGSGFLGFLFGAFAVFGESASTSRGPVPLLCWVILLAVFVSDATVTLFRRMIHGERWYEPHRSHAYQRLQVAGWSHRQITLTTMGMNLLYMLLATVGYLNRGLLPFVALGAALLAITCYLGVERLTPMYSVFPSRPAP